MSKFLKRGVAALLCLCLMLSVMPRVQAAQGSGSFYFCVMTANRVIVEPEAISYTAGQTVEEAIAASGHKLERIEDGSIVAIDGVSAMYLRYYDGGGYDMTKPASEITAMFFCVNDVYSDAMIDLLCAMGRFRTAQNNLQNDPASKDAYANAMDALPTAKADTARTCCDALTAAMNAYEARINGPKYTVNFQVTQAGASVSNAAITMTDDCGNVTTGQGSVRVVRGNYTYVISDGANNRTEGKIVISQNATVTAQLPSGQWFKSATALNENKDPYASSRDGDRVTWYVDDTASKTTVYLYAEQGDVPAKATRLYACYTDLDGNDCSETYRSWQSRSTKLSALLDQGMTGRSLTLEARYKMNEGKDNEQTMIQSLAVDVVRVPTLKKLELLQDGTALYLPFQPAETNYTCRATAASVKIDAQAYTADGTTVTVNGKQTDTVNLSSGKNNVLVKVSHTGGQSRTYQIQIERVSAVTVALEVPAGVDAELRNRGGTVIAPESNGKYRLIPGDTYECVSTKDTWYHASLTFQAADGQTVTAPVPETADGLNGLAFYNRSPFTSRVALPLDAAFQASRHSYTATALDTLASVYAQATRTDKDHQTVTALYQAQSSTPEKCGVAKTQEIAYDVSDAGKTSFLIDCLARSGYSQQVTVRVQKQVSDTLLQYQDYAITIARQLQLQSLACAANGENIDLLDANGKVSRFTATQKEYTLQVLDSVKELTLTAAFPNETSDTPISGGYYAMIGEKRYDSLQSVTLAPAWNDAGLQDVTIQVRHQDSNTVVGTYTLHLKRVEPVQVQFQVTPAEAVAFVIANKTGKPVYAENGKFTMIPGNSYTYNVTCGGYRGKSVTDYLAPAQDTTIQVALEKAPANTTLQDLPAAWPSLRPTSDNNGIIDAKTPITAEDTVLYWANQVGTGWYGDACGCPILVNDALYVYAGSKLYKLDKTSGKVLASGEMDHSSNWCINSATYGGGMIFVGLSDGTVQAFNAATLESVWIYRDALGGQPNCTIAYHDGYVYTGFWRSETLDGNFVCLSITDEDPSNPKEEKAASWIYTAKGGFYWTGACVTDQYVLVGSDDGENGNSKGRASLLCLDRRTGAVLSSLQLPHAGDVRCNIAYDTQSGNYYFDTKGGYFYSVRVSEAGIIDASSLRSLNLESTVGSSSTPTIYNGRAYIGCGGTEAYGAYSGHTIVVIDLTNWEIAYRVETQGNPQTSGVLTTAYDEGDGTVYVYFVENYTPGTMRILKDKPGQTKPAETVTEVYNGKSHQVAPALFTPYGDHTQYCICSPIVDADGTIYFKNDSGYLMAIGSKPVSLEITQQPTKQTYEAGETFDAAGLQVMATYENGAKRDITTALDWNTDALTVNDTQFELTLPLGYQNRDGKAGQEVPDLTVTLQLTVTPKQDPEPPTPPALPFTDVPENAWYTENVRYVYEQHLMYGTTDTLFSPNQNLTRAMFVAMLYRMEGSPEVSGTAPYSDVPAGAYYEKAVIWASANGVVYGSNGKYDPDGKITREQMAAMMRRYAAFCQIDTSDRADITSFGDAARVSSWAREDMRWAVAVNLLYGSGGNLNPTNHATRAEAASILKRFAVNILK